MAKAASRLLEPPKARKAPILMLFFIWRLEKEPMHGYSLAKDMEQVAFSSCKPSTVYSILAKLERKGLVESRYEKNGKRMRKLYQTTGKGRALLEKVRGKLSKGLLREFVKSLISE